MPVIIIYTKHVLIGYTILQLYSLVLLPPVLIRTPEITYPEMIDILRYSLLHFKVKISHFSSSLSVAWKKRD